MTFLEVFALFLMPLILVIMGGVATWLHLWDLKRKERRGTPAE